MIPEWPVSLNSALYVLLGLILLIWLLTICIQGVQDRINEIKREREQNRPYEGG